MQFSFRGGSRFLIRILFFVFFITIASLFLVALPFEQRVVIKSAHHTMIQFSSPLKTKSNNNIAQQHDNNPINNNNIAQQHDLLKRNPEKNLDELTKQFGEPSPFVITFYYNWYANPKHDKAWGHWNHEILDDSHLRYNPDNDEIGSTHWPLLDLYSSANVSVIDQHFLWMRRAKIGVLCITWWGENQADGQLSHMPDFTGKSVPLLMERAQHFGLKVCFHIEPYPGRTALSVKQNVQTIINTYGDHAAFFRTAANKPLFFIYDSYLTVPNEWSQVLTVDGVHSIRQSDYDALFVALIVEQRHIEHASRAGFDYGYSYFGADGFSYGSTVSQWKQIRASSNALNLKFIPCVSPGYDDRRVRPWNARTTRERNDNKKIEGAYYDRLWKHALGDESLDETNDLNSFLTEIDENYKFEQQNNLNVAKQPNDSNEMFIGVTSFNEWHEGTQIEPAVPHKNYPDYSPLSPTWYLDRTAQWIHAWRNARFRKIK